MKIRGNVVNVPADVCQTYMSLPHLPNEHSTIKVKLKRHLKYNYHIFMSENVSPNKVKQAAVSCYQETISREGITYDPSGQQDSYNLEEEAYNVDVDQSCSDIKRNYALLL